MVTLSEVIYENKARDIVIEHDQTCTAAFVALLERTVWGSHGVLFTMHQVADTLNRIVDPHFLTLTENGELVAVAVRGRKTVYIGKNAYDAFHLALLAVKAEKTGQGYGHLLAEQSRRYLLKEMATPGLLYGYIEVGNVRSLELNTRLGYQPIGLIHATAFSRLHPKQAVQVDTLQDLERETLVQLLFDQYAEHALLDFDQSVRADQYYVLRQGREILAGVQIERLHWSIKRLPGISGLIQMKLLPCVPHLHRLFPTGEYAFLRLGNIYAPVGHETEVFTLVESLLAQQGVHLGVALIDRRSSVYQRIAAAGNFGLLNTSLHVTMHVIADFQGAPAEDLMAIRRGPLHISPMDII